MRYDFLVWGGRLSNVVLPQADPSLQVVVFLGFGKKGVKGEQGLVVISRGGGGGFAGLSLLGKEM